MRKPIVSTFEGLNAQDAAFLRRVSEEKEVHIVDATFKEKDSWGRAWFYFKPVDGEVEDPKQLVFVNASEEAFWYRPENYVSQSDLTHPIKTVSEWSLLKVKTPETMKAFVPEERYRLVLSTSVYEDFKCGKQNYTGWTVRADAAGKPSEMSTTSGSEVCRPIDLACTPCPAKTPKKKQAKRAATASQEDKKVKKAKVAVETPKEDPTDEEESQDYSLDLPTLQIGVYDDTDNTEFEKEVKLYEERVREEKRNLRSKFSKT